MIYQSKQTIKDPSELLSSAFLEYIPLIEAEMFSVMERSRLEPYAQFYEMMAYHLGWIEEEKKQSGKRIRPLLVLLACKAAQGEYTKALPAAVAVELIHNFSLIHDDIEDNSDMRRNRPTVWKKWGVPQAINSGDAMFTLAHLASLLLIETIGEKQACRAYQYIQQTCLHLTQGQFLDMLFETKQNVSLDEYWNMIAGKTAALFALCLRLGAICANVTSDREEYFAEYGKNLGLAFQVVDDWLGIWGDEKVTGKPLASDLIEGKKTLPVIYGLQQNGVFAKRWQDGNIQAHEVKDLAAQLSAEGAEAYTLSWAQKYSQKAICSLEKAKAADEEYIILKELTSQLNQRKK